MSTPTLTEDLRLAMIKELREAVGREDVPAHAMSFQELMEATRTYETPLRRWLQAELAAGRWKRARVGLGVKWWKVEP